MTTSISSCGPIREEDESKDLARVWRRVLSWIEAGMAAAESPSSGAVTPEVGQRLES